MKRSATKPGCSGFLEDFSPYPVPYSPSFLSNFPGFFLQKLLLVTIYIFCWYLIARSALKTTPPTPVTVLAHKKWRSLKIAQNFRKNTYIPSTNWIFTIFDETFFLSLFWSIFQLASNLLPTWFQGLKILCRKSLNVTVSTPGVMFWWLPPRASVIGMIINVFETRCGAPPSSD